MLTIHGLQQVGRWRSKELLEPTEEGLHPTVPERERAVVGKLGLQLDRRGRRLPGKSVRLVPYCIGHPHDQRRAHEQLEHRRLAHGSVFSAERPDEVELRRLARQRRTR